MLLKSKSWAVRLLTSIPFTQNLFSIEAVRVGQDTTSLVRLVTKNTKHQCYITVADEIKHNEHLQNLASTTFPNVSVAAEYDLNYKPRPRRQNWRLIGTRSDLEQFILAIQKFEPTADINVKRGIAPI